ncbi:unannotated protein [freshwater metagenome]|uniref:Unannotated protein n=1 Tax=freshwater metagenome TaxID=449393 RepID=A0A6J7R4K8_9ZZZZ
MAAEESFKDVTHPRVGGPVVNGSIAHDGLDHRDLRREGVVLPQEAEPHVVSHADSTSVRWLDLGQHAQQGGLARAVAAHHSDARAFVHSQGNVVEQSVVSVGLCHALDTDQIACGHTLDSTGVPRCSGEDPRG